MNSMNFIAPYSLIKRNIETEQVQSAYLAYVIGAPAFQNNESVYIFACKSASVGLQYSGYLK